MKIVSMVWISGFAARRRATLRTMLAVSNTVRLCYEYVLMLPRPQTNHSQSTFLLPAVQSRMKRKFDICYVMAKESFRKFPALHELEERHGVDLDFFYKTDVSAETFTHYIAESQRQGFLNTFSKSNFYTFHMNGFTDAGNVKDELVLVQTAPRMILYKRWDHVSGISCWRFQRKPMLMG